MKKRLWEIVDADLLETVPHDLALRGLPDLYDGILLDAPCSNTGVIRRRPDARWRLQPVDIGQAAELQLKLLQKAARFVSPQGRLVYSTCSLEEEENQAVVDKFIEREKGRWRLIAGSVYNPWNDGHDGGGAYLLKPARFLRHHCADCRIPGAASRGRQGSFFKFMEMPNPTASRAILAHVCKINIKKASKNC